MNEPQKEYGWITAITPEEIKGFGKPKEGDEIFLNGIWKTVPAHWCLGIGPEKYYNQFTNYQVRRPIDPGEGWELVPREELKPNAKHTGWQFLGPSGNWLASEGVEPSLTYRRLKPKPVEPYGWLKVDSGVDMPMIAGFDAVLENGQECRITAMYQHGRDVAYVFQSSGMPVGSPIAWWYRRHPAPEVVKVSACRTEFLKYDKSRSDMPNVCTWDAAWHACCDHYHVGDQSKGAK